LLIDLLAAFHEVGVVGDELLLALRVLLHLVQNTQALLLFAGDLARQC
jgi:hypothetical protein